MLNEIQEITSFLKRLNDCAETKVYTPKESCNLGKVYFDFDAEEKLIQEILSELKSTCDKDFLEINKKLHLLRIHVMNATSILDELEEFLRLMIVYAAHMRDEDSIHKDDLLKSDC